MIKNLPSTKRKSEIEVVSLDYNDKRTRGNEPNYTIKVRYLGEEIVCELITNVRLDFYEWENGESTFIGYNLTDFLCPDGNTLLEVGIANPMQRGHKGKIRSELISLIKRETYI